MKESTLVYENNTWGECSLWIKRLKCFSDNIFCNDKIKKTQMSKTTSLNMQKVNQYII